MNILTNRLALVLVALMLPLPAGAATLSIAPAAVTAVAGSTFSVDLVISGLGDSDAPSLGVFDIDIGFDPLVLSWSGSSLGPALGDPGLGEALDVSLGLIAPGIVNVAEVSFLTEAELNISQAGSFVIATLEFMLPALAPGGMTPIDIVTVLSLGDALGDPIAVDAVSGAVVTVEPIPLPAAVWLFVCAVGLVSLMRRVRPSG